MKGLLRIILDRSLLLIAGAVVALVWANGSPSSYQRFAHGIHFVVNDVAMVFFFALATKEIVEATLPGGALASPKAAAVPLLAAVAGMMAPAAIFSTGAMLTGHPELLRGWAIPCATDIAFSYLVARMIFPLGHGAIPFLLLLAVADDALGLVVLAVFYPSGAVSPVWCAALMAPAIAVAWGLKHWRVAGFWPYALLSGALSWAALYVGGLHPALALVPIVPFMPHEGNYHELFDDPVQGADTLSRFANWWQIPVQIILFFFGLANAGVPLTGVGPATWLVASALVVGKPVGIVLMTLTAVRAGLMCPPGVTSRDVVLIGIAAGIGFTVALFFATAAFPPGPALDAAKMGALLSFLAAPLAVAAARISGSRRKEPVRARS